VRLLGYHGTHAVFRNFEKRGGVRQILFSSFKVPSNGFFFSDNLDDAAGFGPNVIVANLILRRPLVFPEHDKHAAFWNNEFSYFFGQDMDEAATVWQSDLDYIFAPLIQEDNGRFVVDLGSNRYYVDPDNTDWSEFAVLDGGVEWNILDNSDVVARMQERGYDGTVVYEPGTYSGYSYFVIDQSQIEILEVVRR